LYQSLQQFREQFQRQTVPFGQLAGTHDDSLPGRSHIAEGDEGVIRFLGESEHGPLNPT
jgi:hypothetical protein